MIIGIKTQFDSAHRLPEHQGKCSNLHGHTWHVEIQIDGLINAQGMVMDFSDLKQIVNSTIDQFDHRCINDIPGFHDFTPTVENLALYLKAKLRRELDAGLEVHQVRVQEGEGGYAIA